MMIMIGKKSMSVLGIMSSGFCFVLFLLVCFRYLCFAVAFVIFVLFFLLFGF